MFGEKPLAIGSDFLKEEIAKPNQIDAAVAPGGKGLTHFRLVFLIGRTLRDQNLVQREPKTCSLPFQKDAPDTMHADAVEIACYSRE
jgi:hypothetical protein